MEQHIKTGWKHSTPSNMTFKTNTHSQKLRIVSSELLMTVCSAFASAPSPVHHTDSSHVPHQHSTRMCEQVGKQLLSKGWCDELCWCHESHQLVQGVVKELAAFAGTTVNNLAALGGPGSRQLGTEQPTSCSRTTQTVVVHAVQGCPCDTLAFGSQGLFMWPYASNTLGAISGMYKACLAV